MYAGVPLIDRGACGRLRSRGTVEAIASPASQTESVRVSTRMLAGLRSCERDLADANARPRPQAELRHAKTYPATRGLPRSATRAHPRDRRTAVLGALRAVRAPSGERSTTNPSDREAPKGVASAQSFPGRFGWLRASSPVDFPTANHPIRAPLLGTRARRHPTAFRVRSPTGRSSQVTLLYERARVSQQLGAHRFQPIDQLRSAVDVFLLGQVLERQSQGAGDGRKGCKGTVELVRRSTQLIQIALAECQANVCHVVRKTALKYPTQFDEHGLATSAGA